MSKVVKVSNSYCLLKKTVLIVYVSTDCVLLAQHLLGVLGYFSRFREVGDIQWR